jgi:hypothetical protein
MNIVSVLDLFTTEMVLVTHEHEHPLKSVLPFPSVGGVLYSISSRMSFAIPLVYGILDEIACLVNRLDKGRERPLLSGNWERGNLGN